MPKMFRNVIAISLVICQCFIIYTECIQPNQTSHHIRRTNVEDSFVLNNNKKITSYKSYHPISAKYPKSLYPRLEDRTDYDINSYDTEYGGVVSNFTSSIYEDNPPLYPNPETISKTNQENKEKIQESDIELPDDSLADADLKEHNIIDSVTYLYGFNNCHAVRNDWTILIFIASGLAVAFPVAVIIWLIWSQFATEFRRNSKLYPIVINLCCCLAACTLIYILAVVGASSPSHCEKIALVLHYMYIACAIWIVVLAAAVTEYCIHDSVMSIKYNYLMAYGVPAIVVMFNYALSMEHYETKHYCWMSIEKGMVVGFMIPAMILILINTAIIMVGLQSVNRKQNEMLTAKIQKLVDSHLANWPKNVDIVDIANASIESINNGCTAHGSRKNTDSSDNLDKDYIYSEDEYYANYDGTLTDDGNNENGREESEQTRNNKKIINMLYMDNLTGKWSWNTEGHELKLYLNLCLILEPFFAINWVMGVVAIENASHWSTPAIYMILILSMHIYLAATVTTALPMIYNKIVTPCCEDVVIEPALPRSRTMDNIPLLDPTIEQPIVTPAPADTISTISI